MKAALPFLLWLLFLGLVGPAFLRAHWEGALIVFAAFALVPPALRLLGGPPAMAALPLAMLLALGYRFYSSPVAGYFAVPYVAWAAWRTAISLRGLRWRLVDLCRGAAHVYWLVGAVWTLCFLTGTAPLGLDPTITHLTGAHFHLAGLVLTTAVVCLLQFEGGKMARVLGVATLLGMPVVAMGIVGTHFGVAPVFEAVAGVAFAVMALCIAGFLLVLSGAVEKYPARARYLWLAAALSLFFGATLAGLYALRVFVPLEFIAIPTMKRWHGTANTLGFGWCCLWGWRFVEVNRLTAR